MSWVERIDRFQRNHPRAGLPIAVVYKFFDDQGNYLAALIAYYGLPVARARCCCCRRPILNFVLARRHAACSSKLFDSALGQFPVVGDRAVRPEGRLAAAGWGWPSASSARCSSASASRRPGRTR